MLIVTFPVSHEAAVEDLHFIFLILTTFVFYVMRFTAAVATSIITTRVALAVVQDVIITIVQAGFARQQWRQRGKLFSHISFIINQV